MSHSTKPWRSQWLVTTWMNFLQKRPSLVRDVETIKILILLLQKTMTIKILLLLQKTLTEANGRSRILMPLHHYSLQLKHLLPGQPLTQGTLLPSHPSSNPCLNVNNLVMTFQHQMMDIYDNDNAHVPKIKPRAEWLKPVPEDERPASPEPNWVIPVNDLLEAENNWANALAESYKIPRKTRKKKLSKSDLEGPTFKVVKAFNDNIISLQFQIEDCHRLLTDQVDLVNPEDHRLVSDESKPLPLGGPLGHVTIQPQFFFNKDLENLVSGDTTRRVALSISKLKAANYPDFGLEELEFYINKHNAPSNRRVRILSVISLKKFERYGYVYLRDIVIRRADYNEYSISKADFKNLHPNDFEDLSIVIRQRVGDLQLGIESYQTQLNITEPRWDALDFLFKEDYTIVSKPRAVIYRDRNEQKMMMRENEVHKFSDGTLIRVRDKLDYMVKDFKLFEYNPGMATRVWSEVDKRRSEDFIKVIERRLKIRRIFRNLESFVGGRLRDVDYRLINRT
ncbi:hypothetical protein Tco_0592650 [Tanacetum coccineum]